MILEVLRLIFDWSEVWALFIPLTILFFHKPKARWVEPVKWYLLTALLLSLCIDFIWYVNKYSWFDSRKGHRWNNNIFYNLHSIARLLFFSWFFSTQGKGFYNITRIIPAIFLAGVAVFFIFFESILFINSYLLASETGLLLLYCLWYANMMIRDEKTSFLSNHPPVWVVVGLTLYTAVNFFIFLFYNYLVRHYEDYLVDIWDVHNILFIILCICISIAFYNERSRK